MTQQAQAAPPDAVRAEPGRILGSPKFDASERDRPFPTFVADETLAGRTDRIKACATAAEAFGRDPGFGPQLKAISRIAPKVLGGHVAAVAEALGRDAEAAVAAIRRLAPDYGARIAADLAPDLVRRIAAGVAKAGPPVPAPEPVAPGS